MVETQELLTAIFKSVNSYILARADKKFDERDLSYLLPVIFAWQAALKNLIFFQEAVKASPESIEAMFTTAANLELTAVNPRTKYKLKEFFKGAYIAYWSISVPSFAAGALHALEASQTAAGAAQVKAEVEKLLAA